MQRLPPSAPTDTRTQGDQLRFVESVIGGAGVLLVVLDRQGRFVRFNRECERVSGWRADEVLGRCPWETVLPPEVAAEVRARAFDAAMDERCPAGSTTHYANDWLARDGTRRCIEWTNTVLADPLDGQRCMVSIGIDATDRRATERALADSEARLRHAQHVAALGWWTLDHASGRLEWSDTVFGLFERDPARFQPSYEAFIGTVHPDDRTAVDEAYASSLADRKPYHIEHRLLMPDGRIKWVEERCETSFDGAGRPLRSMGTVRDVTERRLRERELARLSYMVEQSSTEVWLVDMNWRIRYANRAAADSLGYTVEQLQRLGVADVCSGGPEYFATLVAEHEAGSREGRKVPSFETGHRAADGRIVPKEVRATLVDFDGERFFCAFAQDVSERRRAEAALAARRAELRAVLDAFPGIVAAVDESMRYLYVNQRMCEDVGLPAEAIIGHPVVQVLGPERADELAKITARLLRGERISVERRSHAGTDRERVYLVEYRVERHVRESGGHLFCAFALDITDLRRIQQRERRLAEATAIAERANAAKTEFLSNMSHELRTPLNAILGFAQLLQMRHLPPEDAANAREITRAGTHLLELIDEMLDLAAVEAGKLRVELQPVPLEPLVGECVALVRPELGRFGLQVDVDATHDASVLADRGRLRQVLLNLLSNAIKYNRPGGRIHVALQPQPGRCELRVADTGIGLTPEQLARLFVPFERLHPERRDIPGTGIGLSVCKRLVALMGGEIAVDSTPGAGSCFRITLPSAAAGAPVTPHEPAGSRSPAVPEAARTVLYVEDNAANVKLMQQILLQRPQLRFVAAADSASGLEIARSTRPALLLLDIQLAPYDGFELLRRLRAAGFDAPVLAVSANAMPSDVQRGRAAGFTEYLTKPLNVVQVLAAIDRALAPGAGAGPAPASALG